MSSIPVITALRIIPRESNFLDRKSGARGEIFYDRDANTLRLYDGTIPGGLGLARADLANISNSVFAAKASAAGVGGGGGNTTVSVGSSVPASPSSGNLWLNTNNGSLYVYINDGNSTQWIQPTSPIPLLNQYALKTDVRFRVAADDSTQVDISYNNTLQFLGASGITTSVDENGIVTLTNSLEFVGTGGVSISTNDNVVTISGAPNFELFVAADDSTEQQIDNGGVIRFIGAGGVTTTSDPDGTITITGGATTGNVTFTGTTIDSNDSSGIIFTPAVTFESDITVENEIIASTMTIDNIVISGNLSTQGSGTPEIVSDNEINLQAGSRVDLTLGPIRMARFTTAERDALFAQDGDIIYNTTANKFQGYENGTWTNLI